LSKISNEKPIWNIRKGKGKPSPLREKGGGEKRGSQSIKKGLIEAFEG
jgi:hypothetical protein